MPYTIVKRGTGYKVQKKGSKKVFSKKPMPKARAERQMRAILANEKINKRASKYSH